MKGAIYATRGGGYRLLIDPNIQVLRWICLNGNGSRVYENTSLKAVSVPHQKEDDYRRCEEEDDDEEPKEASTHEEAHMEGGVMIGKSGTVFQYISYRFSLISTSVDRFFQGVYSGGGKYP